MAMPFVVLRGFARPPSMPLEFWLGISCYYHSLWGMMFAVNTYLAEEDPVQTSDSNSSGRDVPNDSRSSSSCRDVHMW